MKYNLNLPADWETTTQFDDQTMSIVALLAVNWPDRPIPATAFFQLDDHLNALLAIGWLTPCQT